MCSKVKWANPKQNVTLWMITVRRQRRDAAEYIMIMRNTDYFGFGGLSSRLLYSSTLQSEVTWQWAELTLSTDWTAAQTMGIPPAADWTVGWQPGSMMWCQWKGAFLWRPEWEGDLLQRCLMCDRHITLWRKLRGYHESRALPWEDKLLPWQLKLCTLTNTH